MNVDDETTTTRMILDLTEVHFISLEIQFTYVVFAMTLESRLVRRPNCRNGCGSLIHVHCSKSKKSKLLYA
jgi:hypothetical protein